MHGIGLSRLLYIDFVAPLLRDVDHAAALLGDGSEVLGYDDQTSPDHDFGPRVQIFLDVVADTDDVATHVIRGLPSQLAGHPLAADHTPPPVVVTTPARFFGDRLGTDPAEGMRLADWLVTPTQRLATLTSGAVFHDPDGRLASRRAALTWYPDDVWRYVLAAQWLRIGQEQAFVARTGATGDELGSRVLAARLVRDLMHLAFLVERRWAPYGKWVGRAFTRLDVAARLGPLLDDAMTAAAWRERESALCRAGTTLGTLTNDLGLAAPVDPEPRRFFERDIHVVAAEPFCAALCAAIGDHEVVGLVTRAGRRPDGVPRIPGAIDQMVDSTDVLTDPDRCRALARAMGLG